ncbi:hemocyanin-like protein 1 isoform X2 [Ciona intestinalis]
MYDDTLYPGTSPYDPDDNVDFSAAISGMYETSNRKGALELKVDVDKTGRFRKGLNFISGTVTNTDKSLWSEDASSAFFRCVKGSVEMTSSGNTASVTASINVILSDAGRRSGDVTIGLNRSGGSWVCDVTVTIEGKQKVFNNVAKASDHFRDIHLDIDYVEKVYWPIIELRKYKGVYGKMKDRNLDLFSVFEDAGLKLHYNPDDSQEVKDPTKDTPWSKGDMYAVMEDFFQENESSDQNIWCLQATRPPDSRYMGFSFDEGKKRGFGIFTGHTSFTGLESGEDKVNAAATRRFLHYMAHECGHCLGLKHPFEEGNPNSLSWMNYAWKYDTKHKPGSFYKKFKFSFSDHELEILRHQPDKLFKSAYSQETGKTFEYQSAPKSVIPDYRGYDDEEGETPGKVQARNVRFDIKFRSEPFAKGDIVEFEATVQNIGKLPIKIETGLTPGGGLLTVYVTDPEGNVQIVKPFVHGIDSPTRSYVTLGKPGSKDDSEFYKESVPLFQSSHGSLFQFTGKYHVKAAYESGDIKTTSKSVAVIIDDDDDDDDETKTEVRVGAGLDGTVSTSLSKIKEFWNKLAKKSVESKAKRFQTIVMLLQGLGEGGVKVVASGRSGRRQKRKARKLERTEALVSYGQLLKDTDDLMNYYQTNDGLESSNYSKLVMARGKIMMKMNDAARADADYNRMISDLVRKDEEYGFVKRVSNEWEGIRYPDKIKEKKADTEFYQKRIEYLINWTPGDRDEEEEFEDASGIGLKQAFNGFNPEHREKSEILITELENVEEETDDLDAVLDYADARQRGREVNDMMYRYVIEAYLVHSKLCKKHNVRYPDPPKRDPSMTQSAAMTGSGIGVGTPNELWMNYWRCDADFNFHHNHWHAVYRGGRNLKTRQGELFGYMHAQMLARFNADRETWGLEPVKAYEFDEIPEGFDAGWEFAERYPWIYPRPDKQIWPSDIMNENKHFEGEIEDLFDYGKIEYNGREQPLNSNFVGHILESSSGRWQQQFGSFHNMGHMAFVYTEAMRKLGNRNTTYMGTPLCAVRDPIFFRWHQHVDDLYQMWNDKVVTNLTKNSPDVIVDPCDVMIVPGLDMPTDFDKWGGGDWAKTDFSCGEIKTKLREADLAFEWDYKLDHEPFSYHIRLKRKPVSKGELRLTLRLFICQERFVNQRRRWIEMDKFVYVMPANATYGVVKRHDRESSVIKRSHAATDGSDEVKQKNIEIKAGNCDCGWPYTMLLPRGNKNGEKWLLGVYVSDGKNDQINVCASCGSMSYCGTRDQIYPDKMTMGYPFSSKMSLDGKGEVKITEAAENLSNFCITPFTIVNDHPYTPPLPPTKKDPLRPVFSPLNTLGKFVSSNYSPSRLVGRFRVLLDDTDFHQMGIERVRVVLKGRRDQSYGICNMKLALRLGNTLNVDPRCNIPVMFNNLIETEVPVEGLTSDEVVLPVKTGGQNDYWLTFTLLSPGCYGLAENRDRTNTYRVHKRQTHDATQEDNWEIFQENMKQYSNIYCVGSVI